MLIGLAVVFLLISLLLFTGKGTWLIAGYNTSSKKQKEKYDEKKLCSVMGTMCVMIAVLTGILALLDGESYAMIYGVVIFIVVITTIIYANTKCKKS